MREHNLLKNQFVHTKFLLNRKSCDSLKILSSCVRSECLFFPRLIVLYERIGEHAVRLAVRVREAMRSAGYEVVIESPTNQQFFRLPNEVIDCLHKEVSFDYWGPRGENESVVRFVTSWATTAEDVDRLCEILG